MSPQSTAVDHTPRPESTGIDRLSVGSTIIALGLGTAFSLLGDSTLYTVLPEPGFAVQVGLTSGLVGVALGLNRLVRIAFNGAAGALMDSYAARKGNARNVGVIGVAFFHEEGSRWPWTNQEVDRRHDADPFPGRYADPPPQW